MKKLLAITSLAMMLFVSNAMAEARFGFSLSYATVDATGSETEGGEKTNGSASNEVFIPSIFIEAVNGPFAVGLDYIPIDADVSNATKSRTDTETSVTGTATTTSTSRTQKAQASLQDHITLYANYSMTDRYYLKGGIANVTLVTEESLGTGSKYGDEDVLGYLFGFGITDGNSRLELSYTDYEDISITSSVARTGVTTNNKIEADLDVLQLKYSYAF